MVTIPTWIVWVGFIVVAVVGFICGAAVMRVLYKKVLADKEARLTAVLGRIDTLGEFIKDEILHVEPEESITPKK